MQEKVTERNEDVLVYTVKFKAHLSYGGDIWLDRHFSNGMCAKIFADEMKLAGFEVDVDEHGRVLQQYCPIRDVQNVKVLAHTAIDTHMAAINK